LIKSHTVCEIAELFIEVVSALEIPFITDMNKIPFSVMVYQIKKTTKRSTSYYETAKSN
jgi:hypothetical protein